MKSVTAIFGAEQKYKRPHKLWLGFDFPSLSGLVFQYNNFLNFPDLHDYSIQLTRKAKTDRKSTKNIAIFLFRLKVNLLEKSYTEI